MSIPKRVAEETSEVLKVTARQAKGILPEMIHDAWEQILGSRFNPSTDGHGSRLQNKRMKAGGKPGDAAKLRQIQNYFQALSRGQKELRVENEKLKREKERQREAEEGMKKREEQKRGVVSLPKSVARAFGRINNWRKTFGSKGKVEIKGGIAG